MKQWELCDLAIGAIVAHDPDIIFIDRHIVALGVDVVRGSGHSPCTANEASAMLQQHRNAQVNGLTDYIVNCQGAARGSVWCIISGPGCGQMALRQRVAMGHGEYIVVDNTRRMISDIQSEVKPSLRSHPAIAAYLNHQADSLETTLRAMVSSVHAAVALLESMSGDTADRSRIPSINGATP